jgi:hypothetical protein
MRRPFRPGANFGWIFADLRMPPVAGASASHSGIFVVLNEPEVL